MNESLPILVVEDHNINREVAVLQLKTLGFQCMTATDGIEAVELVKQNRFCLILMDVMMPGMDGWEAAKKIRELERNSGVRTPIVAVSAWSAEDVRDRCLKAGMDDYLVKPYTRESLSQVIKLWIEKQTTVSDKP